MKLVVCNCEVEVLGPGDYAIIYCEDHRKGWALWTSLHDVIELKLAYENVSLDSSQYELFDREEYNENFYEPADV